MLLLLLASVSCYLPLIAYLLIFSDLTVIACASSTSPSPCLAALGTPRQRAQMLVAGTDDRGGEQKHERRRISRCLPRSPTATTLCAQARALGCGCIVQTAALLGAVCAAGALGCGCIDAPSGCSFPHEREEVLEIDGGRRDTCSHHVRHRLTFGYA